MKTKVKMRMRIKIRYLALSFAVGVTACTVEAQQSMPEMPGMQMESQPAAPNSTRHSADAAAADLRGEGHGADAAKARAAAESVRRSFEQQAGQPRGKPGPESDASSMEVPIQELQEPEATGFRTGSDLPAPELLGDVVRREPMTLQAFLALADTMNPTLAQAQSNVDRSNQQARQMGLPPNPVVGYSGDHIRGGSYHGGEQGAFVSQEIVLGRKLALRSDIYRKQGAANEQAVAVQQARIHNDLGRAFFDALAAQQTVMVQDRLMKVALDAETNAHELERLGQADASAVLNSEVAAEQAKVDFVQAQRTFLACFAQLATTAGQTALPVHPLTGTLEEPPELDSARVLETNAHESPAVKQAVANVDLAEARVRSARREAVPNLNLKAGEWYSGEELGSTIKRAGFESFAELGVQLPLWNRNQGNVAAAQVELDRARKDVLRTQLLTRNRAEPMVQQYQAARFTAERYRTQILPRARRAYQLEVTKYQQMALAYPAVLAAQHTLFTLQLTYIRALDDEWQAVTALQNYTLAGALDEPSSVGSDSTTMNLPTGGVD